MAGVGVPKGTPKPPGSGRQKGTPNKRTRNAQEIADRLGCDPFEILLQFAMNDPKALGYKTKGKPVKDQLTGRVFFVPWITPELRERAAESASEYLYPKRKALELRDDEGTLGKTLADIVKALEPDS